MTVVKKTVSKLKSLYNKFEIETQKYKKKEIEILEKQYPLPAVLREYYLKIGEIDTSIEMESFEVYVPNGIRMFTKQNYDNLNSEYKGDFLVFATEITGVCEYAIRKEDLKQENPLLYSNFVEGYQDDGSYWIPASTQNTDEECFDTVLDFLYEVAKSIGVNPDPRNNPKNVQLVMDVLLGNRPESDITPEVIKDITVLNDLDKMQFKNFGAISKLVNLSDLRIFRCEGVSFEPILSLVKLSYLSIRYCDMMIDVTGIERLSRLKQLDLSRSTIQNVSCIKHLQKLQVLELSMCGLDDVSFVAEMHNLLNLTVTDNNITALPPFEGKYKIALMRLEGNKLTTLDNVQDLSKLEWLYVSRNPLTDISSLKGSSYFIRLDISDCLLEDISVIATFTKGAHTIDARNNKIKNLPLLSEVNAFGTLELQNNQIETIAPLAGAQYQYYLELEGNPLKDISEINNIPKLISISISKEIEVLASENYDIRQYDNCKTIQMKRK